MSPVWSKAPSGLCYPPGCTELWSCIWRFLLLLFFFWQQKSERVSSLFWGSRDLNEGLTVTEVWLQFCGLGDKTTVLSANSACVSSRSNSSSWDGHHFLQRALWRPLPICLLSTCFCRMGQAMMSAIWKGRGLMLQIYKRSGCYYCIISRCHNFLVSGLGSATSSQKNSADHNKIMSFRQVYAQANPRQCSLLEHDRNKVTLKVHTFRTHWSCPCKVCMVAWSMHPIKTCYSLSSLRRDPLVYTNTADHSAKYLLSVLSHWLSQRDG